MPPITDFKCTVRRVNASAQAPPGFDDNLEWLRQYFFEASDKKINLEIVNRSAEPPLLPSTHGSSSAYELHTAAQLVTGNAGGRVRHIALLIADEYRVSGPAPFGVMFDRGRAAPNEDNETDFMPVPREACALFTGTIARKRADDKARAREAQYTTIHEMGHLFNLPHLDAPPNFMARSPDKVPHGEGYWKFQDRQKQHLRDCEWNAFVWPGGLPYDGRLYSQAKSPSQAVGWDMRISTKAREFARLEPVELDIRIDSAMNTPLALPAEVDPGCEAFTLWIETPDGERRRFRSPRRYVGPYTEFKTKRFERDLSLWLSSGGYTFERPGPHVLIAELQTKAGVVRSNPLAINILPDHAVGADIDLVLLRDARVQSLLYHREPTLPRAIVTKMLGVLREHPKLKQRHALRYALVRVLGEGANQRRGKSLGPLRGLIEDGLAQPETLGDRQRFHLERLHERHC